MLGRARHNQLMRTITYFSTWPASRPSDGQRAALSRVAVDEVSNDRIALAGGALQPLLIEYVNMTAAVLDQSAALQAAGSQGHAGSASAEHGGQELLREIELWALKPVLNHKQPAGQALLDFVQSVTGCKLRKCEVMALDEL